MCGVVELVVSYDVEGVELAVRYDGEACRQRTLTVKTSVDSRT